MKSVTLVAATVNDVHLTRSQVVSELTSNEEMARHMIANLQTSTEHQYDQFIVVITSDRETVVCTFDRDVVLRSSSIHHN